MENIGGVLSAWKKKKKRLRIGKNGKKLKMRQKSKKPVKNGEINGTNGRKSGGQEANLLEFRTKKKLKKKMRLVRKLDNSTVLTVTETGEERTIKLINGGIAMWKKKEKTADEAAIKSPKSATSSPSSSTLKLSPGKMVPIPVGKSPKSAPASTFSTPKKEKIQNSIERSRKTSESTKTPEKNGERLIENFEKFTRPQLPIDIVEQQLMYELATQQTLIIIGETGSGKSTQVPQLCVRAGLAENGAIAVTEPRRVAAVSLATRVALEMGTNIAGKVGYHVRFENATSQHTKIEYMTDGIVLRKALIRPLLEQYSTVIIDEAHERSLHSDVLMCILKKCQEQRKDTETPLRLIIMSATLQADKFKSYFNNAKVVLVAGRTFPIEVMHIEPKRDKSFSATDYIYNTVVCVKHLHLTEPKGHDILVFLTGSEEIESVAGQLAELNAFFPASADVLMPVPLYAALRPEKQKEAFRKTPQGARKVIISTNIAETSVTIPGIRIVVDSGKVKTKRYDASDRIDVLKVHNVSKAQAKQRAGRAGRDAPGKCYRLYSREDFKNFEAENMPEILRCNLSATFLELIKLGMKNPHKLALIDRPEPKNIDAALLELTSLGAIRPVSLQRSLFVLTDIGNVFCMYPLPPDHARILYTAQKEGCIMEAIKIVAAMQTDALFSGAHSDSQSEAEVERARKRFETREGDHLSLLNLVLASNVFFEQLNKKTQTDERFGKGTRTLEKEYNSAIRKYCNDNMINEQHLKTASLIEEQLKEIAIEQKVPFSTCGADFTKLRKCLAQGLFLNSCEYNRQEDRYQLMINPAITMKIHPSSVLSRSKPAYIVFSELMKTNDLYALQVSLIDGDWVRPLIAEHKKMRKNHLAESAQRVREQAHFEPKCKKSRLEGSC
ncbi:unnamed protein product [Caenorhabditis sp. 36 PRJEB53466]|nr:unnamed protein product [Caenorhabditis sp. 36 PRJEB53466]